MSGIRNKTNHIVAGMASALLKILRPLVRKNNEPVHINGGEGSGNFGHEGRPGEQGGSMPTGSGRNGTWTPEDRAKIKPEHIQQRMKEIAAISRAKRDDTEFTGPIDRPAAVALEAHEMMPKKDGQWKGVGKAFYLENDFDAVVNVEGKPYLAVRVEDPDATDDGDEKVWSFHEPHDAYGKGIETSFDDKQAALAELRVVLRDRPKVNSQPIVLRDYTSQTAPIPSIPKALQVIDGTWGHEDWVSGEAWRQPHVLGGSGSGNFGHDGRPGEVGGPNTRE